MAKYRGWFRLWIVASLIAIPTIAELDFQQKQSIWEKLDQATVKICVDREFSDPNHPDSLDCARRAGAEKTVFEHENTTPLTYWSQSLGIAAILDLVATAIIIAGALIARWVWRGFQNSN